ncbi:MAG: hypothetical protein HQ477_06415 [Chloroflexi bacterium]|nr:hypothetical protein [Chloroflexota bacterium]
MKKLSWLPIRSVILALSVLLIAAAVACESGNSTPKPATTEPAVAAGDDAMVDDGSMKDGDTMVDGDVMPSDDPMMGDDTMMEHSSTMFNVLIENIGTVFDFSSSGVGGDAPAGPGDLFTFEFDAAPGDSLSFASMFVPSNDFFFAPSEEGIQLYDDAGVPISGDVTDQITLWDAGTEANQEPGAGSEQPLMNGGASPNTPDSNGKVRPAEDTFGNLPEVSTVVSVSVNHIDGTKFEATIENVSTGTTLNTSGGNASAVPLTPPLWVVHSATGPLFTNGESDRGEGLEALAETGSPVKLNSSVGARTGLTSPIAPGVFAIIDGDAQLYVNGQSDQGLGLEALAEDGSPGELAGSLVTKAGLVSSGVFTTPTGATGPAPAFPGDSYEFEFEAIVGDRLSLATMLVQSNDLFYAPKNGFIELFDSSGNPISGDLTSLFLLWDAGTEVNQAPGAGADQAPRQSGPNAGETEMGTVAPVADEYTYPDVDAIIRVTITTQG